MYFLALALFLTAAATDYFDGKLARDHHVESDLGEILDPIADKLLLLFVLIVIILESHDAYIGIMSCLILAREIWITGLREYAARINLKDATKVTMLGKSKTTIQFIAVAMFLLCF
jgi:CDP-diacylglycerol--glycerol-3-phosphate 3-phosphatidyltransferase